MYAQDSPNEEQWQESARRADELSQHLQGFVAPLLQALDVRLDKRLVRTFFGTLEAMVRLRNRHLGLLLSELGGVLLSPQHAPAGTKRLSNLLRSRRWQASLIASFLWRGAERRVEELEQAGEPVLAVWDESCLEKPESIALEGLCAVRSTKAARLKHIRPGFYNPPGGRPVFVPGLHWLGVLVVGYQGPLTVAAMRWWSSRGIQASDARTQEKALLSDCVQAWGQRVLHLFDRGFAGSPWTCALLEQGARFVIRWNKKYDLVDGQGRRACPGRLSGRYRSWDYRQLRDIRRHCWRKTGVVALPVTLPEGARPLWLVVSRPQNRPPWYLLTNEPITEVGEAWRIVLAYARRWQIEWCWRYSKSELAMESPRLRFRENREKLLLMVTLVYAFLLSLLVPTLEDLCRWLLRRWCPRTGQHCAQAAIPLYRIRAALAALWSEHRPPILSFENPG